MRIKKKEAAIADVDMTPMIDIVFQLIAFFMVITNFENTRADERVKLPKDELAKPPEIAREDDLLLNIGYIRNQQGEKQSDALLFYGDGETYPVLEIGPVLEREVKYFKDLGTEADDVTIVIRSDAEIPTGLVQETIKFSQEAGFSKFALKATQKVE
ncbi:ExbD/TolR family protein [Stratiformator vulcanicus]|uniref:Biopolymer transport protein ExbD/TolR n=1 Tax=Stratiformator vulcanicus TaxID=2527980 RepID=A0A517R5L3_9PLAN|nr:biopolymer transporter ExbD [Stratiformator vulcanicus]QDT39149.1 Biopolymer transport protein ExbD/TolR [Stratiformator vulcanicus]